MGTAGMSMNHCGVLVSPLHTVVDNRHHFLYSSNGSEERNSHLRVKPVTYGPKPIRKCVRILRMLTLSYWLRMLKKGKISWQWSKKLGLPISFLEYILRNGAATSHHFYEVSSLQSSFYDPSLLASPCNSVKLREKQSTTFVSISAPHVAGVQAPYSLIVNACVLSRLYLVTRDGISVAPSLLVTISSCKKRNIKR